MPLCVCRACGSLCKLVHCRCYRSALCAAFHSACSAAAAFSEIVLSSPYISFHSSFNALCMVSHSSCNAMCLPFQSATSASRLGSNSDLSELYLVCQSTNACPLLPSRTTLRPRARRWLYEAALRRSLRQTTPDQAPVGFCSSFVPRSASSVDFASGHIHTSQQHPPRRSHLELGLGLL